MFVLLLAQSEKSCMPFGPPNENYLFQSQKHISKKGEVFRALFSAMTLVQKQNKTYFVSASLVLQVLKQDIFSESWTSA